MATPWRPRLSPLAPAGHNTSLNSDISIPAGTQAKEHAASLEHTPMLTAGKRNSFVGPDLLRIGARQAFDAWNVLTWACWASRHSKVASLACGTFSQVATLRSATRALVSYHLTTGSRATPCFAALFVTLPACTTCPQQSSCLPAQYTLQRGVHLAQLMHFPDSDRGGSGSSNPTPCHLASAQEKMWSSMECRRLSCQKRAPGRSNSRNCLAWRDMTTRCRHR